MTLTRACTIAAALALVCVVIDIGLSIANQSLRQQVSERQQIINQGLTLSQINTRLANALALIAARDSDDKIRKILSDSGITMKADQPIPQPAATK